MQRPESDTGRWLEAFSQLTSGVIAVVLQSRSDAPFSAVPGMLKVHPSTVTEILN